jgi:uncharacterized membrane protein
MIQVTLYFDKGSEENEAIFRALAELRSEFPHTLHSIDITQDRILAQEYQQKAPILDIGTYRIIKPMDIDEIRYGFEKAFERYHQAQTKGNQTLVRRLTEPPKLSKSDRFSYWFSNHTMLLLNSFVFFYLFFAILAPSLMKLGWERPARVIYRTYSVLCHQLSYRSFFLFGEQIYYPRELASVEGVITYEEATGFDGEDMLTARQFLGDETLGYKIALCQRDVAIYGSIFLFGIIFALTGHWLKPLPWYLWLLLGLVPIGLDGFSQLLGQSGLGILHWIPIRESTPLLRVITGGLFGLSTAWFGYPYVMESVEETRKSLHIKRAIIKQINRKKETP